MLSRRESHFKKHRNYGRAAKLKYSLLRTRELCPFNIVALFLMQKLNFITLKVGYTAPKGMQLRNVRQE